MPRFDDSDLGVDPNSTVPPARGTAPDTRSPRDRGSMAGSLPIPNDAGNTVEVPATRSSISDAAAFMHNLSLSPSTRDRRGSRNSFGTSLPIPRSPRVSRLSSAVTADAAGVSRDILASQVQDMSKEKVAAAKNMAFAFDIDGVLAHGNEVLRSWMEQIHNQNHLPENIYMVGDNPASDICGGNMHGWNTCLVRTGVFQGRDNDENNPANFGVFPNVLEAVKAAVRKELGQEFKMKWNPKVNPVLHGDTSSSAVE